jgi:predicted RNase H-like HicB family nuclease
MLWSQGATEEEAIENIQDAIKEYLAATMAGIVRDAGLTPEEFKKLL